MNGEPRVKVGEVIKYLCLIPLLPLSLLLLVIPRRYFVGERLGKIHRAVKDGNPAVVRKLLRSRPKRVAAQTRDGRTPLHLAAEYGRTDIAAHLISRGADVNAWDKYMRSPLHFAADRGDRATLELLLAHESQNINESSALCAAIQSGHRDIVELLLARGVEPTPSTCTGATLLHMAAAAGQAELADLLIGKGADVNATDEHGETPLHLAFGCVTRRWRKPTFPTFHELVLPDLGSGCFAEPNPIHQPFEKRYVETIALLLAHGAKVNLPGRRDWTPLHLAVARNCPQAVEWFLARGADVNAEIDTGLKPLLMAEILKRNEIAMRLMAHGAESGIFEAVARGQTSRVESFLRASPHLRHERGPWDWTLLELATALCRIDVVELLLNQGADVTVRDDSGETPLHRAIRSYDRDLVERFLARGIDPNTTNHAGKTALQLALELSREDFAKLLISHGADIHAADADGMTPLHCAAIRDSEDTVWLLLSLGADISAMNRDGRIPRQLAQGEVRRVLERAEDKQIQRAAQGKKVLMSPITKRDLIAECHWFFTLVIPLAIFFFVFDPIGQHLFPQTHLQSISQFVGVLVYCFASILGMIAMPILGMCLWRKILASFVGEPMAERMTDADNLIRR